MTKNDEKRHKIRYKKSIKNRTQNDPPKPTISGARKRVFYTPQNRPQKGVKNTPLLDPQKVIKKGGLKMIKKGGLKVTQKGGSKIDRKVTQKGVQKWSKKGPYPPKTQNRKIKIDVGTETKKVLSRIGSRHEKRKRPLLILICPNSGISKLQGA